MQPLGLGGSGRGSQRTGLGTPREPGHWPPAQLARDALLPADALFAAPVNRHLQAQTRLASGVEAKSFRRGTPFFPLGTHDKVSP